MKKGIWIIVTALLSLGAIIGANALVSTTNVNTMKKKFEILCVPLQYQL